MPRRKILAQPLPSLPANAASLVTAVSAERPGRLVTMLACLLVGIFAGTGGFTFASAKGASYLSDDPAVCVNCHIMRDHYDGWRQGSHHAHATCNDCHLPQENVLHKFYVKASNGYRHSKAFTLQNFAEPIRIVPSNSKVLEGNCLRCHAEMTDAITAHGTLGVAMTPGGKVDFHGCVRCHVDVGHGPRR
jgi:cytochrome c nitrite reductase small subunit